MREEALRANRNKGEARRAEIPSRQLQEVQRQRQERSEAGGGRDVIREPDRRVIVRERNRTFIRHDENQRLARSWRGARSERRGDGTALSFFRPRDGSQIFSEIDADGRALRRYRAHAMVAKSLSSTIGASTALGSPAASSHRSWTCLPPSSITRKSNTL